jgi:uncharacterized protein (TIGR02391 family)
MRWDDLELLQLIDRLEQSDPGPLYGGLSLMQRAAAGRPLDPNKDYRPFAHELRLAAQGGFLTWKEQFSFGGRMADPELDPNMWLQQISQIELTIAGRDRARGQKIQRPHHYADEDDDRPIFGSTLEEIAKSIADVFTTAQLPRFLGESGISNEYVPPEVVGGKWEYTFQVFDSLHEGGSEARRVLRSFIGEWLGNLLQAVPEEQIRKRVEAQLLQQGWHVRDSRLVVGERQASPPEKVSLATRRARVGLLHPAVRQVASRYVEKEMLEVAIFEAFKAVNNRVKELSNLDADGSDLMGKAFGGTNPLIRLADLSTETGRNIQEGFRFLFMGAVRGIRNPDAHELFRALDEDEALERLALASLLMRRLDETSVGEESR